jgi:general secretion pathway protein N
MLGVLFLACVIATAPARLLDILLPADVVILRGYSGTLWRGAASRCLVAAGPGYIHLGEVHWSLAPLSLLSLSPSVDIESSWGKQQLKTGLRVTGSDSFEVKDLNAVFSVQILRQFLPLAVSGDFSVQIEGLRFEEGLPTSARGRVVWQRAAWESARGALPLGSYAADFQQLPNEALQAEIVTLAGPVNAAGRARLLGKSYSVDILVTSESGLDAQLEQALSLIAQPVSEGYHINFGGQLTEVK